MSLLPKIGEKLKKLRTSPFWGLALHWIFPKTCVHCKEDLPYPESGVLCADCFSRVEWVKPLYCARCGIPLDSGGKHCFRCRGKKFKCDLIRAAVLYTPEVQSIIHCFKYAGRQSMSVALGEWMRSTLEHYPEISDIDALVPVPLHPKKLRERGYNQAILLAENLRIGKPVLTLLSRVKNTATQWNLSRKDRLENVCAAFEASPAHNLKGKNLLLVDDVCTTGATLEECAAALKRMGARRVFAFVSTRQIQGT